MWVFDHLAVVAGTLSEGVTHVERALGIAPDGGGRHPDMGTWNKVLSLGSKEYLEVISVDPAAERPDRARWFDLDRFAGRARIGTWVCRTDDLGAALAQADPMVGRAIPLERGDYRWAFAVADDGAMPFEGAHPALIEWRGPHPADRMADYGLRLAELVVTHPDPTLVRRLAIDDQRIDVRKGEAVKIEARINTPAGDKWLG